MARIAGINIPVNKHVVISLTSIFGIGRSRAKQICTAAGVAPETQVKDLAEPEVAKLRTAVANFEIEGDLRREISMNIKRLMTLVLTVVSVIGEACRYAASVLAQMLARGKDRGGRLSDNGFRSALLRAQVDN